MKLELSPLSKLILTHDLSCTITSLIKAVHRYPPGAPFQDERRDRALTVAAVAFTIQIAIDHGGADPDQMRALERAFDCLPGTANSSGG